MESQQAKGEQGTDITQKKGCNCAEERRHSKVIHGQERANESAHIQLLSEAEGPCEG